MTREEKFNLLNELLEYEEKNDIGLLTRAERREFQQWISEALEQEPTPKENLVVEDCISRADVNQVIEDYMDEQYHVLSDRTRERAFGTKVVMARINELPSVTPQEPRKGHWIKTCFHYTGVYSSLDYVRCSCCKHESLEEGNYCPNCGAKMESEVEK